MKHEDALAFAGTRLAFHTFQAAKEPADAFGGLGYVETTAQLNREAAEALGKPCLDAYEGTLHILNRGKR